MSWIIGRSAGSTQPSLGRVSLSLHSYQNPQFGMTINKIPLLEIKDFGPPARGGHFVLFTPSAIRHAVSRGSYFTGSTSVPSPPPRRWEGIKPLLEIKDFGPPARGGHFVLFHSFLPPQPYGTQFHTVHTSPVQLVFLPLPPRRWEGIKPPPQNQRFQSSCKWGGDYKGRNKKHS